MAEPFIGQIIMFAGRFAPRGWVFCNGQTLAISQYEALFAVLGTTYGGDGETTFALPDLRGRVPVHAGTGSGLTERELGKNYGQENVTLTVDQLPAHSHSVTLRAYSDSAGETNPEGKVLAEAREDTYEETTPDVDMASGSVVAGSTGGGEAVGIVQPMLAVNYIIAVEGRYPAME